MQGITNQLLYNLVHLYLWRSLAGGLWVCLLDLCPQDTKRSFKLEKQPTTDRLSGKAAAFQQCSYAAGLWEAWSDTDSGLELYTGAW